MADEKTPAPQFPERLTYWGRVDAGMRAAANFVTMGYADKLEALMRPGSYADNMARNEAINKFDRQNSPETVGLYQGAMVLAAGGYGALRSATAGVYRLAATQVGRLAGYGAAETATATAATVTTAAATTAGTAGAAAVTATEVASAAAPAVAPVARSVGVKVAKKAAGGIMSLGKVGATMTVPLGVAMQMSDVMGGLAPKETVDLSSTVAAMTADTNVTNTAVMTVVGATALAGVADMLPLARMTEQASGLLARAPGPAKPLVRLAGYGLKLAWNGATSTAKGLGFVFAGGEVAASAYVASADQHGDSVATTAREAYVSAKSAAVDLLGNDSYLAKAAGIAVLSATAGLEAGAPLVSDVVRKEQLILHARDLDLTNPAHRMIVDGTLLAFDADPEDPFLQKLALKRLVDMEKDTLENPKLRQLASAVLLDEKQGLLANPAMRDLAEKCKVAENEDIKKQIVANADMTAGQIETLGSRFAQKWLPLEQAIAAAEKPRHDEAVYAAADPAPAPAPEPAKPVVHHRSLASAKPQSAFNRQAALPAPPLPPLVAMPEGGVVDTAPLLSAGTPMAPELDEMGDPGLAPTMALNTRTPSSGTGLA